MLHNKWKNILICFFFCIVVVIVAVKVYQYAEANALCRKIREGNEIHTSFSNGSTAPLFLDNIAVMLQSEGPKIPLVEACYYRNIQAVEVLLQNGADPDFFIEGQMSPLEAALWCGPAGPIDERSYEIVKLLIKAGADITLHASEESVIISLASKILNNDPVRQQILLYLLDHCAYEELDEYNEIIHHIVRFGNVELARMLISDYNVDVNTRAFQDQTPLILAVYYGQYNESVSATPEMIEMLLAYGAEKDAVDSFGKSAYDYAVMLGYDNLVDILKK